MQVAILKVRLNNYRNCEETLLENMRLEEGHIEVGGEIVTGDLIFLSGWLFSVFYLLVV